MVFTIFLLFKFIYSTGQIVIAPITDVKYNYPPCKLYNLASFFATAENLVNLTEIIRQFGIEKILVDIKGTNSAPLILSSDGSLSQYDPINNTAEYRFCAKGKTGSLVEPDFSIEPIIFNPNDNINPKKRKIDVEKMGNEILKPAFSAIIRAIGNKLAMFKGGEIDTTRMLYECGDGYCEDIYLDDEY